MAAVVTILRFYVLLHIVCNLSDRIASNTIACWLLGTSYLSLRILQAYHLTDLTEAAAPSMRGLTISAITTWE